MHGAGSWIEILKTDWRGRSDERLTADTGLVERSRRGIGLDGTRDVGGVEGDIRDRQRAARFVEGFGREGGVWLGGDPRRVAFEAVESTEADLIGRIGFEFDEFVGEMVRCDDPAHAPLGLRAARIYARVAPNAATPNT